MRFVGVLMTTVLGVAVVAQGAYIFKTRKQVDALTEQVRELALESDDLSAGERPTWAPSAGEGARPGGGPQAAAARLPPPRFVVPAPSAAPLPAALDHPETREQLRQFVAATLQAERDGERDRQRQRRDDEERQRTENMAKTLGLNGDETRKFTDILANMQTSRQQLRQKIQSGELEREQVVSEFQSLRAKTDTELKQLLGDDRMKKWQEMRGGDRRRGGPGGEGGGGRRWGGPAGGAPVPGQPPG